MTVVDFILERGLNALDAAISLVEALVQSGSARDRIHPDEARRVAGA